MCEVHYAVQFEQLRASCGLSLIDYCQSLSRAKVYHAKGGKSGSMFYKTADDRFILKNVQKIEMDSFLEFAPLYFDYLKKVTSKKQQSPTLLRFFQHKYPQVWLKFWACTQLSTTKEAPRTWWSWRTFSIIGTSLKCLI